MGKIIGLVYPEAAPAPDRVQCPHCDKSYASQESLDKHIKDKHPEQTKE